MFLKQIYTSKIFLLAIFLLSSLSLFSQSYKFKNFGYNEGLSNVFINSIEQCENGHLWVNTGDGLFYYDGFIFTNFEVEDSIKARFFTKSYDDVNGNLWVGDNLGGIHYKKDDKIQVVLGGSILQKAKPPVMADLIKDKVQSRFPNAKVIKLKIEPVLGAVFLALDLMFETAGRTRMAQVKKSYQPFAVR